MNNGFWEKLNKPIVGLSPMDGVTDAPFRYITTKISKPDIIITEFTSVEGICAGATKTLEAFIYSDIERPIIAQLFGTTPECFYKASFLIAELGFDGIDINMGCPSKNVASKGSGAALIQTPKLAKEIILSTKKGIEDWTNGKTIADSGLPKEILDYAKLNKKASARRERAATALPARAYKKTNLPLPVSVKTRIGFNSNIGKEWIKHLLETKPAAISIHGRTLKQMYSGEADWETIGDAAKIIKKTDTNVLGNGDISSFQEAIQKIKNYGVDGALIGRATFGNPWFFLKEHKEIDLKTKFKTAIEHSKIYEKFYEGKHFTHMRKHLGWYCKGFFGASEIRQELMQTNNAKEVEQVLKKSLANM